MILISNVSDSAVSCTRRKISKSSPQNNEGNFTCGIVVKVGGQIAMAEVFRDEDHRELGSEICNNGET